MAQELQRQMEWVEYNLKILRKNIYEYLLYNYSKLKTVKISLATEEEEQNTIDKNVKLNHELYLQNQKANPDDII